MNLLGTSPSLKRDRPIWDDGPLRDVFPGRQERPQRWFWRFVHRTDGLWTCRLQQRSSLSFWWCVVYLTADAMPSTSWARCRAVELGKLPRPSGGREHRRTWRARPFAPFATHGTAGRSRRSCARASLDASCRASAMIPPAPPRRSADCDWRT
jgi:hypothetical protein